MKKPPANCVKAMGYAMKIMKQVVIGVVAGASLVFAGQSVAGGDEHTAGKKVFNKWCSPCHAAGSGEHPGTAALGARYGTSLPAALEERVDIVPSFVGYMVRRGGGAMPSFKPTDITDSELGALAAYLTRNTKRD